jgi:hypothetical protein
MNPIVFLVVVISIKRRNLKQRSLKSVNLKERNLKDVRVVELADVNNI